MGILAPAVLLLLAAGGLAWLQRYRPRFGGNWLVAVIGSLVSWLLVLLLRFQLPTSVVVLDWERTGLLTTSPMLVLDYQSWPYSLAVVSLILAIVLSSPLQLRARQEVVSLAGSLALAALGYLSTLAANPVTILLAWTAFDLLEFSVLLRNNPRAASNRRILVGSVARFTGMLFTFWIFSQGSRVPAGGEFASLTPGMGLILLVGIVLRLGLFPTHIPYHEQVNIRRSQGNIFRLVSAACSLVLLSRLPSATFQSPWIAGLRFLLVLVMVYVGLAWIRERRELDSRPYWVMALSGLAILATLNGAPQSSVAWGTSLVLLGGLLYLHDAATPALQVLMGIGLLLVSGLPFTPNAVGLSALLSGGSIWSALAGVGISALVWLGMVYRIRGKPLLEAGQERILSLVYPLGAVVLLLSYLLVGLFGWPGSRTAGSWLSFAAPGLVGAVLLLRSRAGVPGALARWLPSRWLRVLTDRQMGGRILQSIYHLVRWLYAGTGRVVDWFTFLLEGSSGLVWGLVLLVLLVMLVGSGAG